jgi:predicted nuclease with TOPRIM domain
MHIIDVELINKEIDSAANNKHRRELYSVLAKNKKKYKNKINDAEKYNSEFADLLDKHNPNMKDFTEELKDFIHEIIILIFKHAGKQPANYRCALLEENDKGTLFLDGKQYKIHVN